MEFLGILRLEEFSLLDIYDALPDRYKNHKKEAKLAFESYINENLRYNSIKGEIRTDDGWISKYNFEKPIYNCLNLQAILQDEFMPWINNSISRQLNGYTTI